MGTRPYVIRQGDYLDSLALRLGIDAGATWRHPDNRELAARRDPNQLAPGDVIQHDSLEERRSERVHKGGSNRYRAVVPSIQLRVRVKDAAGRALSAASYRIEGAGSPISGQTDGDGWAAFSVGVWVTEVLLSLEATGHVLRVNVAHMDPLAEDSGVARRLAHLGFLGTVAEPNPDEAGDRLSEAIGAFQRAHSLPTTGTLDGPTRDALIAANGS